MSTTIDFIETQCKVRHEAIQKELDSIHNEIIALERQISNGGGLVARVSKNDEAIDNMKTELLKGHGRFNGIEDRLDRLKWFVIIAAMAGGGNLILDLLKYL